MYKSDALYIFYRSFLKTNFIYIYSHLQPLFEPKINRIRNLSQLVWLVILKLQEEKMKMIRSGLVSSYL